MPLITVVIVLIVVGILLYLANTYLQSVMDAKILKILNAVVVLAVILWLLGVFGIWGWLGAIRVGPPK